jgi:nucleotide-binding universal stress UspA family protein
MFNTIMLAYDESQEAARALAFAIELAAPLGAHLKVVTVVEPLPSFYSIAATVYPSALSEWLEEKRRQLRALQQNAIKRATLAGVKAEAILVNGGEVSGIIRAAEREHADLLVIGLPKHHGLGAFLSTAHEVSDLTPCPLLEVN